MEEGEAITYQWNILIFIFFSLGKINKNAHINYNINKLEIIY